MIRARGVMHLDGNLGYESERFSLRKGSEWRVVERGRRYLNEYVVTEFDAAGEQWLKANDRTNMIPE